MKKSVMFLLLVTVAVSAFDLPPPSGPFTASSTGTATSSGFSLQPPDNPFTNAATGSTGTGGTGTGGTGSGTGSTGTGSTSGTTSSTSSSTSGGTSGGGSRGGGGGGLIRIDLSGDPVIRSIPLGRTVQFSKNGRHYPSLLILRKVDARTKVSSWALEAKFYDIPVSSSKSWDLSRDDVLDVVVEVLNIDRTSVMIKASVPTAFQTPAPRPTQTLALTPRPASTPEPVYQPQSEPEFISSEPLSEPEIVFVEEEVVPWFPVRTVAVVVGVLLLLGLTAYAIKRKYSAPRTLVEYIQQGLYAGHLEDEIRARLERAGWEDREIDAAMRSARRKNI